MNLTIGILFGIWLVLEINDIFTTRTTMKEIQKMQKEIDDLKKEKCE